MRIERRGIISLESGAGSSCLKLCISLENYHFTEEVGVGRVSPFLRVLESTR